MNIRETLAFKELSFVFAKILQLLLAALGPFSLFTNLKVCCFVFYVR